MRVSAAVMAHPDRRAMVDDLLERLDRPATVVWDQRRDEWDTARRAWLAHDPAATHHLVLQDDAVVCADLVAGVEQALAHTPPRVALSLYFGAQTPFPHQTAALASRADAEGASWLAIGGVHWGVALVLPVPMIGAMVDWGDRNRAFKYDRRVSRWLETRRAIAWYPWPSLVDHRDGPSLVAGHGIRPGRVAHRFAGKHTSALDLDLCGPVLDVGLLRRASTRYRRPQEDPMPPTAVSADLLVARVNAMVTIGAGRRKIRKGQTTAHVGSWIAVDKPHLWEPIAVDFPADEPRPEPPALAPPEPPPAPEPPADDPPGDDEPVDDDRPAAPPAKDVRAWAKANEIEVPSRGPLPDDIVERYQAANQRTNW